MVVNGREKSKYVDRGASLVFSAHQSVFYPSARNKIQIVYEKFIMILLLNVIFILIYLYIIVTKYYDF